MTRPRRTMRLRRLRLSRYGIFSGHEIDFGEWRDDAPDLHIVHGPNEAGKSTALAAFLDLIFGIETRSSYGFRHGLPNLRIDAEVEIRGETRRFARIKRQKNTLLDADDRPVDDDAISGVLGGMDRGAYRAMFSLDDHSLEEGGEEILKSEGRLGPLLFAAGAGLEKVSETLDRLLDRAARFKKGKRITKGTDLHVLRDRLAELDARRKELDTGAADYARLIAERDRTEAAYDKEMAERAKLETALRAAQRRLRGLPLRDDIRRLRAELAGLEDLPDAPQVWFKRIGELIDREPRLATRIEELGKQRDKRVEERKKVSLDKAVLAEENRFAELDGPRSRYDTADKDLPRRRDELGKCKGAIDAIAKRVDAPGADPETLVVSAAAAADLHDLIGRREGIEERIRAAARELERAQAAAGRAKRALKETGGGEYSPEAIDRLRETLAVFRADNCGARLDLHMENLTKLRGKRDARMAQLHPWSGEAEELAQVRVPEADRIEAWRDELGKADADIEKFEKEKVRLESERGRHSARAEAKRAETGVADDDEAARLRAARDEAWSRHRAALDTESADAFEAAMREDDSAAAGRLAHASALAAMREAAGSLREVRAEIERNAGELDLARRRRQAVLDAVGAAVETMIATGARDLPPDTDPHELSGWVEQRSGIVEILDPIGEESVKVDRARGDIAAHRARLAETLAVAGIAHDPDAPPERLASAAESAIAAEGVRRAESKAAREAEKRTREDLNLREREAETAAREDAEWRAAWTEALSRCWLGGSTPPPSTARAKRILHEVGALESEIGKRDDLARRIAAMETDRTAYADEVRRLAERLGAEFDPERVFALGDELRARLDAAREGRKRREALSREIEAIDADIEQAESERVELRAVAGDMFAAFGVESLREVYERLQAVAHRAKLRETLAAREAELCETMKTGALQDAEADLEEANRDALETEEAKLDSRLADMKTRMEELHGARMKAEDKLDAVGGDGAVARIDQERRTVLLEIQEGARDWLRLRLGLAAAEGTLRFYRDRHRGPMMKAASEAFRTVTREAYAGLESRLGDKGEELIANPAGDGPAKLASDLSKGTRFQLYLALRAAGYGEFARDHGSVPFIADDILETFDDFRAEEAFRVFSGMAEYGQVVYLSHHRHLRGIAKQVCRSVTIHELPDPSTA